MAQRGGVPHSAVDRGVRRQSVVAWGWCGERRLLWRVDGDVLA